MVRQQRGPHVIHVGRNVQRRSTPFSLRSIDEPNRIVPDHLAAPGNDQERRYPRIPAVEGRCIGVTRVMIAEIELICADAYQSPREVVRRTILRQ